MYRVLLSLTLATVVGLGGCASVNRESAALSVPDGKHRRPANPNGSVLEGGLRPALADAKPAGFKPAAVVAGTSRS